MWNDCLSSGKAGDREISLSHQLCALRQMPEEAKVSLPSPNRLFCFGLCLPAASGLSFIIFFEIYWVLPAFRNFNDEDQPFTAQK